MGEMPIPKRRRKKKHIFDLDEFDVEFWITVNGKKRKYRLIVDPLVRYRDRHGRELIRFVLLDVTEEGE